MQECFGKSMLWKSRRRSRTKKLLYRNFKAGSLEADEHYLGRAGLRGRKIYLCYGLLVTLLLFSIGHLMVTCTILGVLRFEPSGFPFLQIQSSSIVWPRGGNLTNITIATPNAINSFLNRTLSLSATQEEKIQFESMNSSKLSSLSLSNSSTNLLVEESFHVASDKSSQAPSGLPALFVNSTLMQVQELSAVGNVTSTSTTTHTVNEVERVESSQTVALKGAGGVAIRGRTVDVTSSNPIRLNTQGTLHITGNRGVQLLNLATPNSNNTYYHVCITSNGTVFLVPTNPLRCRGDAP